MGVGAAYLLIQPGKLPRCPRPRPDPVAQALPSGVSALPTGPPCFSETRSQVSAADLSPVRLPPTELWGGGSKPFSSPTLCPPGQAGMVAEGLTL